MASPVLTRNNNFRPHEANYGGAPFQAAGVMTMENTMKKIVSLFGILLVGAVIGWFVPILFIPAAIAGLVLGLVNAFKREPSVPLIISYAAVEGIFVGGISSFFEQVYPGIVVQAVLATLVVTGVTLALFANGVVRATPKLTKFFLVAMLSYAAFSVINLLLMVTGVTQGMYGLRSVEVFGIPLGVFIGIVAVLLATYSLIMDFTFIQNGINNRVPEKYGWTASFGIMVTIVWLYLEILRLIGIFRN
jgi:uncharacterized YccA/Bax inhibitor family protein